QTDRGRFKRFLLYAFLDRYKNFYVNTEFNPGEGESTMKRTSLMHSRDTLSAAIATALFAVAMVPASAFAQQAAAPGADATTLDSVTVTGYRYAIEKSLESKRDANAVVEVI